MVHEHDCGMCDPGTRHRWIHGQEFHRVDGLLVRPGSITEARLLRRRDETSANVAGMTQRIRDDYK